MSYSQITVFNEGLENPFSDWTDAHLDQGFVWRQGSVSFGALSDFHCEVEVALGGKAAASDQAVRSIAVPFTVGNNGVTIASILSNELNFAIPAGTYELLFEAIPLEEPTENGLFKVRYIFKFVASDNPKARILKHDEELSPPDQLVMTGEAAI
ncbi:competence protein ComJ [Bacillus sp. V3-13]|uniref:competence protein ComJ n=1 Tax=Bacillus sp. V3-13 TaxID=2053728 RepID=UPI0021527DD7|nr:competence protein ComJ [Bacillus sp. V3-13]